MQYYTIQCNTMQYHQLTRMPYSSSVLLLCPRVTKNTILLSLGSDDDYHECWVNKWGVFVDPALVIIVIGTEGEQTHIFWQLYLVSALLREGAWVTRPERPKGAKDEVKGPEGPPTRSRGPEGP